MTQVYSLIDANGETRLMVQIDPAPGGASVVLAATKTLTDSQIKTLPTAGVELVAAPGSGKIVVPVCAVLVANYAAGLYSGSVGDYYTIGTGNDAAELMTSELLGDLGDGSTHIMSPSLTTVTAVGTGQLAPSGQTTAQLNNAALTISASASGNWTGGGVGNTLSIALLYYVMTF